MMRRVGRGGFSLVELLLVIGIISIILAFVVPAADHALRGSSLAQSGQMVGDQIAAARQIAVARNRTIYVRFYELPGEGVNEERAFCAVQLLAQNEDGTVDPVSKVNRLHENVCILDTATYSTLIAGSPDTGSETVQGRSANYVGFRFLPDGSTDLSPTGADGWFLTLVNRGEPVSGSEIPGNFYTIRLNPRTGQTRVFRP